MVDIPTNTTALLQDAGNFSGSNIHTGALQTQTDAQVAGYVGPCPPIGQVHRYIITVFALKAPIQLEKNASPALTGMFINMNAIAKASLLVYGQQ